MGRCQQEILAGCGLPDPPGIPAQLLLEPPRPEIPEPDLAASQPSGLTNRRMRTRMSGGVRGGGATPPPTRFPMNGSIRQRSLPCGTPVGSVDSGGATLQVFEPARHEFGPRAAEPEGRSQRAKQRANRVRFRATPADGQRQSPQVGGSSGDTRRRRNTQKIWFASRRPGVRVPLAPRIFRTHLPPCTAAKYSNGHLLPSSGSAASAEPRASPNRLSAASVAWSGTIVYSSIVIAILLCRRIRIATRGCTSKAASSEPQVRRVSCTRIRRTPALAHRRSNRRPTARGSIGRPVRVVNPAGLTARARPEARPHERAANLSGELAVD
jgi:hypothetical protein